MTQTYAATRAIADASSTLVEEALSMDAVPTSQPRPEPVAFHYTQTDSFVALLRQLGMTLLVSPLGRRLGTDLERLCDPNVNESR